MNQLVTTCPSRRQAFQGCVVLNASRCYIRLLALSLFTFSRYRGISLLHSIHYCPHFCLDGTARLGPAFTFFSCGLYLHFHIIYILCDPSHKTSRMRFHLSLLAFAAGAAAQQSSAYIDANTGITFQGKTDTTGFYFGMAVPTTIGSDFIGQMVNTTSSERIAACS